MWPACTPYRVDCATLLASGVEVLLCLLRYRFPDYATIILEQKFRTTSTPLILVSLIATLQRIANSLDHGFTQPATGRERSQRHQHRNGFAGHPNFIGIYDDDLETVKPQYTNVEQMYDATPAEKRKAM